MSNRHKYITRIIQEEIENAFLVKEQEEAEAPADPEPEPAPEADVELGGDEGADLGGDETGDIGDANLGDTGGAGAGLEGEEGDLGGDDLDAGGSGGGFAGGGGFSGGGGFGSSGSPGLEPDDEEEEDTATTVGPEDVEFPDDPVMMIADESIKLLNKTQQPEVILKNTKGLIQKYFDSFEDATPVIKALWDTENYILRDVAKRLLLFIKGD